MVSRVGVVGLGLIGGSIAKRLVQFCQVVGVDPDPQTRAYAEREGIVTVTGGYDDLKDCEAVFVAPPIEYTETCVRAVYAAVGNRAVITDVASVKGILSKIARRAGIRLVGGHPMAGTEFSGIAAAKAHLFENAYYALVRYERTSAADFSLIRELVGLLGARVVEMSAEEHDMRVAETSHMPHVVSYALASAADGQAIAGTGFNDMTRIARSDPAFWRSVLSLNRENTLAALGAFRDKLDRMEAALTDKNYGRLETLFAEGKSNRDRLESAKPYQEEYVLEADIRDEVGALARVGKTLADNGINVKSMAIVHSREGVGGALRLGFGNESDCAAAKRLLCGKGSV